MRKRDKEPYSTQFRAPRGGGGQRERARRPGETERQQASLASRRASLLEGSTSSGRPRCREECYKSEGKINQVERSVVRRAASALFFPSNLPMHSRVSSPATQPPRSADRQHGTQRSSIWAGSVPDAKVRARKCALGPPARRSCAAAEQAQPGGIPKNARHPSRS